MEMMQRSRRLEYLNTYCLKYDMPVPDNTPNLLQGGRGEQARRRRMDANFNRARMPQSSKDEEAVYSSTQGVLRIGHSLCATQPLI